MKKISGLFFLLTLVVINLLLTPFANAQTGSKLKRSKQAIPNRYIVVLNENVVKVSDLLPIQLKREIVGKLSEELASSYSGKIEKIYTNAIKGYAVEMSAQAAEKLSQDSRVKYVEEDFVVRKEEIQTNASWGIDRIDQRFLSLNSTYNYDSTGAGVHAYVLDSGIRSSHVQFGGRVVFGADFVGDGQNGNDCDGHGTHVAGIIGSANYGVAKQVTIHNVRVLNCQGEGEGSDVLAAIEWVTANNVKPAVVNMSLGSEEVSPAIENAITNSIAQGINYALSAGNENMDACNHSPGGRVPNAIAVAASGIDDFRWSSSNYGSCVDIFAPGSNIISTWNTSDTATFTASGTSMAAPHVAGVIARFLQTNPLAPPAEVKNSIVNWSTKDVISGAGAGSPNRLLYSKVLLESPPVPSIIIPSSGVANLYPATYTVSGISEPISTVPGSVQVKINGFSHRTVQDIVLVLVGPNGAAILLKGVSFSNVSAGDASFTISDTATQHMSGSIIDGATYKPTSFGAAPVLIPGSGPGTAYNIPIPVGAPENSGYDETGTLSMTFGGINPNGLWKLYAIDARDGGPAGSILSWSLVITNPPTPTPTPASPPPSYETSVSYAGSDSGNMGSWKLKYGSQGVWTFGDTKFLPSWAQASVVGQYYHTWAHSTTDVRAAQKYTENLPDRIAATFYTPSTGAPNSQFEMNFDFTDGQAHRLALYCLDWDNLNRQQTFEVVDFTTGAILDTRTISNFQEGVYVYWKARGRFKIRVKNNGATNAVVSAVFLDAPPPPPIDSGANFIGFDATTKGNWIGKYGNDGYLNASDSTFVPNWAQISQPTSNRGYTWAGSTNDERALLKMYSQTGDRSANAVATLSQLEYSFNFPGNQTHRLAFYCLDWDGKNRQQIFEIINDSTGEIFDSRLINNFNGGVYVSWQIRGRFKVRVRNVGGSSNDAVISGVFIDSAPVDTIATFIGSDQNTKGDWVGNYGGEGYTLNGERNHIPNNVRFQTVGSSFYNTWQRFAGTELRAIRAGSGPSESRTASAVFGITEINMHFDFTDGQMHRLALYCLDWDGSSRKQTIEIINSSTGVVIDTRTLDIFNGGVYLVWQVKGRIKVRVRKTAGPSAVVSGVFIDSSSASALPEPITTTTNFVGFDASTKGNWIGAYGLQGHRMFGASDAIQAGEYLDISGINYHVWANSTADERALIKAPNSTNRQASTIYNDRQLDMMFYFSDRQSHRVAFYSVDWDNLNRQQTFELIDPLTGTLLDTRTINNFSGGTYVIWQVKGRVIVRIKNAGGNNVVLSGIFTDPPSPSVPSPTYPTTAGFVGIDSANQGNWIGKYASQGISIPGDTTNFPSWLQFSVTGHNTHTWAPSTSDSRALTKNSNNNDRIASTLYTSGTFNTAHFDLNFNFTDGEIHRLALYAIDWDNQNRQQTFELINTTTGAILDARTISNFSNGAYVIWNVQGRITVRVKNSGAASLNAVLSGIFIDSPSTSVPAPPYPTTASFINFDTNSQGNWIGKYASQGVSIPGDATSFPGWVGFSVTGHNSHTWATSTADPRALIKTGNHNDRVASTLYTSGTFNEAHFDLNFNLTDGQAHRLTIYNLDWDNQNRRQTIEIVNTATGEVLDARTINNFANGVYLSWTVRGSFIVRVKNGGGTSLNAVLNGVFID